MPTRRSRLEVSKGPSNNHKRKLDKPIDESDEDDEQMRSKCQIQDSKGSSNLEERPLACPFHKYDNILFGPDSRDEAYRNIFGDITVFLDITAFAAVLVSLRNLPTVTILARIRPVKAVTLHCTARESLYTECAKQAIDYEGSAAEVLNQFDRFCTQVMPEILPIVQQRLGLLEPLPNDLLLQQEIQQEASQRYSQYIRNAVMPRLPRSHPGRDESAQQDVPMQELSQQTASHAIIADELLVTALENPYDRHVNEHPFGIFADSDQYFNSDALPPYQSMFEMDTGPWGNAGLQGSVALRDNPNPTVAREPDREAKSSDSPRDL
ncbi:MAG: hypothetical protein Q9160_005319 [Pyrenula sp. 1 TL-2023]